MALAAVAHAEVKINDNLALSGFAVGALTSSDTDSGGTTSTALDSGVTNFDAVKVALTGTYDAISGKVSLFYVPESTSGGSEAGLLDGYLTYTAGPVSFTGGKFLSYLGYEAWDAINMTTISYGNSWNAIPGYHSGAKVDFAGDGFALGAAVTDSLYMDPLHFFGGDGDFGDGLGYEVYANYTGVEKLTLFFGLGIEDEDGLDTQYVYNFWASYALTEAFSVAAELTYNDNGADEASRWALFGIYTFSDTISVTGRVSGVIEGIPTATTTDDAGTAFTIAPTYTINENFAVRAEVTYADSAESAVQVPGDQGFFYALQGIFKF
ncbi:MAG: hypothetical protein K0S79_1696 [Nitrospira sp.]|nr:hypothetical protein [Nitrospira sp.]